MSVASSEDLLLSLFTENMPSLLKQWRKGNLACKTQKDQTLLAAECNPSGPGHPTVLSSREETQADKHTCRRNSTQTCICSNSVMHTTVFLCLLQHCLPHTASYLKLVWIPTSHLFIGLKKGFHFFPFDRDHLSRESRETDLFCGILIWTIRPRFEKKYSYIFIIDMSESRVRQP